MPIDIGLTDTEREASVGALKKLLGETYALYAKTHGYHWNVTGPRFNELHAMFMAQYVDLWNALDLIAERIRVLGHFAPLSLGRARNRGDAASRGRRGRGAHEPRPRRCCGDPPPRSCTRHELRSWDPGLLTQPVPQPEVQTGSRGSRSSR